jgi:hypothetical protein
MSFGLDAPCDFLIYGLFIVLNFFYLYFATFCILVRDFFLNFFFIFYVYNEFFCIVMSNRLWCFCSDLYCLITWSILLIGNFELNHGKWSHKRWYWRTLYKNMFHIYAHHQYMLQNKIIFVCACCIRELNSTWEYCCSSNVSVWNCFENFKYIIATEP